MAKVEFDPIIKWITGKIGKLVYRRAHNGKVSTYPAPDTPALARRCKCVAGQVE
jgi:hypothetical protein